MAPTKKPYLIETHSFQKNLSIEPLVGAPAVPLSGGWDSAYCLWHALRKHREAHAVFFEYGQPYLREEREASAYVAVALGATSFSVVRLTKRLDGQSLGKFKRRNATILSLIAFARPSVIYFGSRNLLPVFDRYGDSNWLWAKRLSKILEVDVRTPCTGLPKSVIINRVSALLNPHRIFSTEAKRGGGKG